MGKRGYQPIEDYGIIGDLHTIALVGVDGSIDFLSFPHFDSPTVFAALLDAGRGGRFQIRPCLHDGSQKQMYLPDTNVLITRTLASDGVAEVSDYMPVGIDEAKHFHTLVRRAKCVRGRVAFDLICEPHFDYARADHTVEQHDSDVVFNSRGSDKLALRLRASVPVRIEDGAVVARFTLSAGETAAFVLEQANPEGAERESPSAAPSFVAESFKATVNFWRAWLGHSQYTGRWRDGSCAGSRRAAWISTPTSPCRSCTATTVARSCPRRSSPTSRATGSRGPCALATPPTRSSNSTSTASSWTRSTSTTSTASPSRTTCGRASCASSTGSPGTGTCPTRASGRCGTGGRSSCTRASCAGWRSTGASASANGVRSHIRTNTGARVATRSPTTSSPTSGTQCARRSCGTKARALSTRRACLCH